MTKNNDNLLRKVLLLILARQLENVETACRIMGFSKEEYEILKELYTKGGEAALSAEVHPENAVDELVSPETEQAVLRISAARPRLAHSEVVSELLKQGITVSPSAILRIWKEYGMDESV
jgi:transposase